MTASVERPTVVVGGLGPAGPDLITVGALELADRAPCWLRTIRHPAAARFDLPSFDALYESAASFDDVYRGIVEALVAAALQHGQVGYLVPGSPMVAEHTVELLLADDRVDVHLLPAVSFLEVAWTALGIDPVAEGVELVDGHRFAIDAAGRHGPMLVAQCHDRSVLSAIKLALDETVDHALSRDPALLVDGASTFPPITVLQRLGGPDEAISRVALEDLDRVVEPDHLTSLYVPRLHTPVGAALIEFHELVRTLRSECPWDREQTHQSLVRFLIEETYEVVEAIESVEVDPDDSRGVAALEDELGDLLFQVVFHSVLGAEAGHFDLADVARTVHDKLVRRHPHVFAPDADHGSWEEIKAAERGDDPDAPRPLLAGVPPMPPLARMTKIVGKVTKVGFDWASVDDALAKLDEELGELRAAASEDDPAARDHELGDVILAAAVVGHHLGVDVDAAARNAVRRFTSRFDLVEAAARAEGVELSAVALERQLEWWAAAKAQLAETPEDLPAE